MLDLDEAISHAEEVASCGGVCGLEHAQLAAWLRELREARARIAMVHEWFGRERSIIYELSESIRVDIAQAAAAEREACAKVAAKIGDDLDEDGRIFLPCEVAYRCESAIRARGAKEGE